MGLLAAATLAVALTPQTSTVAEASGDLVTGAIRAAGPETRAPGAKRGLVMIAGLPDAPPPGLTEMCARRPAACASRTIGALTTVTLTPERRALLQAVNHRINAAIWPELDPVAYGREEYWTKPLAWEARGDRARGDCEDYALEKRDALIAAGFPAEALYLAVGHAPHIGVHAVLIASTDQGDLVLDNRVGWIETVERARYSWVSRQSGPGLSDWSQAEGVAPRAGGRV
jgi:predicted transglutaminase-like cysteine proteinase